MSGLIKNNVDADGNIIISPNPLNANKSLYFQGFTFEAIAGTDTESQAVKYKDDTPADIEVDMQGLNFKIDGNAVIDDYFVLEIVDVDNILGGGAGAIVGDFGKIYVAPNEFETFYSDTTKKTIPAGLYLRCTYTSTGVSNVKLALNPIVRK